MMQLPEMNNTLKKIYTEHHKSNREKGFSIMKNERGELLKEFVGQGKKVLDIGCRDGALTSYFATGNEVLGVDIDEVTLHEAEKLGIDIMVVDLNGEWRELEGKKFNVIVAGEVLEHLYYPEKVTEKVSKLLLPDGQFIGSVPNAFSLKNRLRYLMGQKAYTPLSDHTHITQFHINELRLILEHYFSEVKIMGLGRFTNLARVFPGFFGFDLFFIARL